MEQMIYKLNLPPLEKCILDGVVDQYFKKNNDAHYIKVNPVKVFIPQILSLKNLHWNTLLIFLRKSATPGPPHTDNVDPENITTWGINWIYNGFGTMEYWDPKDYSLLERKFVMDQQDFPTFHIEPKTSPDLKYLLKPGAYLVNTSMIHRPTGFQNRYCVSLRSSTYQIPWSSVVELFDDMIIRSNINLPVT
jgi:hypothetical protein